MESDFAHAKRMDALNAWARDRTREEESQRRTAGRYVRRKMGSKKWRRIRARVFARDGERCAYCGKHEGPWEIDHVMPLRHGGTDDLSNLRVSCRRCNQVKKAKVA